MLTRVLATSVAGFLLGIFYASLLPLTPIALISVSVVSVALIGVASVMRTHGIPLLLVVFCLCGAVLGALRFDAARLHTETLATVVGEKVRIVGRIRAAPDVRDKSVRLTVDATSINEQSIDVRMLVIAPPFSAVRYGDTITIEGALKKPESFETGEGRAFNYPMYLAVRGIAYEVAYAKVGVESHGGNPFVRGTLAIKAAYIRGLRAVLPEPYAGLAAGITAGDKRSVGSDLSDTFQKVSLIHILVLSGYNITVVLGMFAGMFARLHRWPRFIAALFVVSFFVVVAGGAASAVRAGAMALAAVYAHNEGRMFVALRVLVAIVFVMVLWNPLLLVFDPGFQLSVLATLGLIVFAEPLKRLFARVPEKFQIREILAATIATQVCVLPLLLYQSGNLSLVSLPSNLLALVAVPFAMLFSAVAALSGILMGTWGVVIALPAYLLLRYIISVATIFAAIPYASLQVPAFSVYVLGCMYTLLALCALYLYRVSITKNDRR